MSGIELIAAERQRQIAIEGWTPEHDDEHDKAEMTDAAECYLHHANLQHRAVNPSYDANGIPWEWPWRGCWWKPSEDRKRNLVKAGALIAAELDRLERGQ